MCVSNSRESRPAMTRAGHGLMRPAIGVFVLSLVLRLIWASAAHVTPISDHYGYDATALHWAQTGEYRHLGAEWRAYRPPGYPAFLALLYLAVGHNHTAASLAQAVLGALTSGLLVLLAGRVVGRRAAGAAGLLHTFCPTAIAYVPVLASDNLAVFLLVAGLTCLLWSHAGRPGYRALLAGVAGVAFAAMFLTRPAALFFLPAWLLLAWYEPRSGRRHGLNLLVCSAFLLLGVGPWFVRNHLLGLGWTTITTQGGYALWWGNNGRSLDGGNPAPSQLAAGRRMSEIEQHRFYQRQALEWIRDNPGRYLALSGVRLLRYFGTQPDTWAAKYFFPSEENDKAVLSRYWKGSRWPERAVSDEYASRGVTLETRNRKLHKWFRVIVAPLMLLSVLLALRRLRAFLPVLLPLAFYVGGLALTVFAARYRTMGDPLVLVTLGALLSDLLFGTHELGRWGGRWVKLTLVVLAVAGSVAAHATGVDRTWYRLPRGWEPDPPTEHLVPHQVWQDVRAMRGIRPIASSSCQTDLTTDDAGVHCRLTDTSGDSARSYGGLRVPVPDFRTVGLDLTWHDAENIDAIFVVARGTQPGADGDRRRREVRRWEWHPKHREMIPPREQRRTYVLTPEGGTGHFIPRRAETSGDAEPGTVVVDELRIVVRVKPGTPAGFTLHGLVLGRPAPGPALREFGGLVALLPGQVEQLTTVSSRACQVNLGRHDDRVVCELRAAPDTRGHAYGGVRFGVPAAAAFELQLAFEQPEAIDRIFVVGYGPGHTEAARWEWPVAARRIYPVAGERGRYTFVPGQPAGPFEAKPGTGGPLVEIRVLVRVLPGITSGFILHRVTLAVPSRTPTTIPAARSSPPAIEPEAPEAVEPDGADRSILGDPDEPEAAGDEDNPDAPFEPD